MPRITGKEAMLAKGFRIEECGSVMELGTSDTMLIPAKPENEKKSDDVDGSLDNVCDRATIAFALSSSKPSSSIVLNVALALEPLLDTVTECRGMTLTADETGARPKSSNDAVSKPRDADPISMLCPDCTPGNVVNAPGARIKAAGGH